jgi:hypothetical protein
MKIVKESNTINSVSHQTLTMNKGEKSEHRLFKTTRKNKTKQKNRNWHLPFKNKLE